MEFINEKAVPLTLLCWIIFMSCLMYKCNNTTSNTEDKEPKTKLFYTKYKVLNEMV